MATASIVPHTTVPRMTEPTDQCTVCDRIVPAAQLVNDRCLACTESLAMVTHYRIVAELENGLRCRTCVLPLSVEDIGRRTHCAFCRH